MQIETTVFRFLLGTLTIDHKRKTVLTQFNDYIVHVVHYEKEVKSSLFEMQKLARLAGCGEDTWQYLWTNVFFHHWRADRLGIVSPTLYHNGSGSAGRPVDRVLPPGAEDAMSKERFEVAALQRWFNTGELIDYDWGYLSNSPLEVVEGELVALIGLPSGRVV